MDRRRLKPRGGRPPTGGADNYPEADAGCNETRPARVACTAGRKTARVVVAIRTPGPGRRRSGSGAVMESKNLKAVAV